MSSCHTWGHLRVASKSSSRPETVTDHLPILSWWKPIYLTLTCFVHHLSTFPPESKALNHFPWSQTSPGDSPCPAHRWVHRFLFMVSLYSLRFLSPSLYLPSLSLFSMTSQQAYAHSERAVIGNPPVVQWLRLCAPNTEHPGLIPGWGSHMPQLKNLHATTKIQCAVTKTQHRQINMYFFKKKRKKEQSWPGCK